MVVLLLNLLLSTHLLTDKEYHYVYAVRSALRKSEDCRWYNLIGVYSIVSVQETLRNLTNSAEILRGLHKASVQLTAELQYYFRQACLPFLQNHTSQSMNSPYPVNVFIFRATALLYLIMAHKLCTGSYIHTLNTIQSI